jgi:hypothetical protein
MPRLSQAELDFQRVMLGAGRGSYVTRNAKNWFFDKPFVVRCVDSMTADALAFAGSKIRARARNIIYRRDRPSRPWNPPNRHVASDAYASLTNIWFAFDPFRKSVVVGPLLVWNKFDPPVPERMEFGYSETNVANPFHRPLKIGGSVPAKFSRRKPKGKAAKWKGWRVHKRYFQPPGTARLAGMEKFYVLWRKAKTSAQLAAGVRLQNKIWGPPRISYTVAPRPYMRPALLWAKPLITARFAGRLRAA